MAKAENIGPWQFRKTRLPRQNYPAFLQLAMTPPIPPSLSYL